MSTTTTVSTVTTFAIFQQLLRDSVNKDPDLSATTKASMLARIDDLPQKGQIVEDFSTYESFTGDITVDAANRSIEVGTTVSGNNRVIFAAHTFPVPATISGVDTLKGFHTGGVGTSPNPEVEAADLSVQYRFSSTDPWKNLAQASLLGGLTSIQFAVDIADQGSLAALPQIVFVPTQE